MYRDTGAGPTYLLSKLRILGNELGDLGFSSLLDDLELLFELRNVLSLAFAVLLLGNAVRLSLLLCTPLVVSRWSLGRLLLHCVSLRAGSRFEFGCLFYRHSMPTHLSCPHKVWGWSSC